MAATPTPEAGPGPGRRAGSGPVYDTALRRLGATDLVTLCRWLGVEADADSLRLSEALPASTQYADLLARVGPGELAHVEFVRTPGNDLGQRMVEYRARIMGLNPGVSVRQHVVVLAGGLVPERVVDGPDFEMRLRVTYLRDHEPAELLADPSLAPLAVLGRETLPRAETLRRALAVIAEVPDPDRRVELADIALVLAAIHLDAVTIDAAAKEARMPITLDGTVGGRTLEARGEARGRSAYAVSVAEAALRRRFGDDPRIPDLALSLADRSAEEILDVALSAPSLDHLAGG